MWRCTKWKKMFVIPCVVVSTTTRNQHTNRQARMAVPKLCSSETGVVHRSSTDPVAAGLIIPSRICNTRACCLVQKEDFRLKGEHDDGGSRLENGTKWDEKQQLNLRHVLCEPRRRINTALFQHYRSINTRCCCCISCSAAKCHDVERSQRSVKSLLGSP